MSADPRAEVERRLKSLLDERLAGLSRRIREWLEESHARAGSLAEIVEEARRDPLLVESTASGAGPAGTPSAARELGELASFAREVECSADQTAILGLLLDGASSLASRALLMVVRSETLVGWSGRGFAQDFEPRRITTPATGDTVLARALSACAPAIETPAQTPGNEQLARMLGGAAPAAMMASPLWVRDRVAALLYADAGDTAEAWYPDAIRLMVSLAALSLEAIPARSKHPRPAPAARPAGPRPAPTRTAAAARPGSPTALPPASAASATPAASLEEVDPEEARHHEDARRFARLLVSEILLYNEKEIEEGRRNKDLYERLKEDIDRSRQMYLQRMASRLPAGPDYFHQELVRTLANGDESALNVTWD